MKLKDLAKELKATYVSFNYGGKTITHKKGTDLDADTEVPKGITVLYNDGKGWKELKGGKR